MSLTLQTNAKKLDAEFGPGEFELLNAGHGGWGTSDYIRYYEEYGDNYDVEGIISFFGANDVGRSVSRGQYGLSADGKTLEKRMGVHRDSKLKKIMNSFPGYNFLLENSQIFQALRLALIPAPPQVVAVEGADPTVEGGKNKEKVKVEGCVVS